MYAEERRKALINLIRTEGRLAVTVAAGHFEVTPETIRRDLEVLDRQGVVRRVHGGAVLAESLRLGDHDLTARNGVAAELEDAIAIDALGYLPDPGACIILDAGTTVSRLADRLPADYTVVTNGAKTTTRFAALSDVDVLITDRGLSRQQRSRLSETGIEVVVA